MNNDKLKNITIKTAVGIILVLCGLFFRIHEKTISSLWTDEFATCWVAGADSPSEVIKRTTATQGQSPFYFLIVHFILKYAGKSEFSLRFLSLTASLVSVILIYELAAMIFSGNFTFSWNNFLTIKKEKKVQNEKAAVSLAGIFASLLFILDPVRIYYAQEARPYALATMFVLLSQLFFFKLLIPQKNKLQYAFNLFFYILFSAGVCYSHYIFGLILAVQNVWIFILMLQGTADKKISNKTVFTKISLWIILQAAVILMMLPLFFQIAGLAGNSRKWTWLKDGSFSDMLHTFLQLFDLRFILIFSFIYLLLFAYDFAENYKHHIKQILSFKISNIFVFIILWITLPVIILYFAGKVLHTSFISERYLTLSLLGVYFAAAAALKFIDNSFIRIFLVSFLISAYIGGVLAPLYKKEHRFCHRIPHDWKNMTETLNYAVKPGDIIILRSGYIKENWVPAGNNELISDYVKAPLKSFYFRPAFFPKNIKIDTPEDFFQIYNMTYSREFQFYPYYNKIFSECEKKNRVWILGVDPPNTNYKISQVPELLRNSHQKIFEKNFSGVYLVLMKKFNKKKVAE